MIENLIRSRLTIRGIDPRAHNYIVWVVMFHIGTRPSLRAIFAQDESVPGYL